MIPLEGSKRHLVLSLGMLALLGLVVLCSKNRRTGWQEETTSAPSPPNEFVVSTPSAEAPKPTSAPPSAAPAPTVSAAPDVPSRPESEDAFLAELERLNVTDKPRALALAEAGERWYSDRGVKAEARQAMRITLLVDLGRMEEARALVRQFLANAPDSRYLPLVQGVTGVHPRPEPDNSAAP